jgi:hypothetical protein
MFQLCYGQGLAQRKLDAALVNKCHLGWIAISKFVNEAGLAVNIYGIFGWIIAQCIDANGATAFGFWCQKTELPPTKVFLDGTDTFGDLRRLQNNLAQTHECRLHFFRLVFEKTVSKAHDLKSGKN